MNDFEYLIGQILSWPDTKVLHEAYLPLFNLLRQGDRTVDARFDRKKLVPIDYDMDEKCTLLYSGGKCSIALAIDFQRKHPLLYYVGNNRDKIRGFANELDLEYVVENKKLDDSSPLYIVWIIALAIKRAVENHMAPIIYLGTFEMSSIHSNPISMWKNCVEIIRAFEYAIRQVIPSFQIKMPMPSYTYVWEILMKNKGYLKYVWCDEALDAMIFDIAKDDWEIESCKYYILYIEKMKNWYEQELGYRTNLRDFWKRYFFYDIIRSNHRYEMEKLFGE